MMFVPLLDCNQHSDLSSFKILISFEIMKHFCSKRPQIHLKKCYFSLPVDSQANPPF